MQVKQAELHWRRMRRAAYAGGACWSRPRRSRAECLRALADRPFFITPTTSLLSSLLLVFLTANNMAAPTKQALTELFNTTMRTSREFSSYNFRNYFVRRTKSVFQEIEVSPAAL